MTGADTPADAQWRWWRERRLPAQGIHLDSAAAGRSSLATLAASAAHAEREAVAGGYVAAAEAEPVLAEGRSALARLLGVPPAGVTFVPSAQAALDARTSTAPPRTWTASAAPSSPRPSPRLPWAHSGRAGRPCPIVRP